MKTRHLTRWAGACTGAVVLSALAGFAAADTTPYERMAPLEQYLMPPGFRDRTRAQCRAGRDLRQGHGPHSRFAGLPDRRPRHQRIHLSRGEVVDVAVRSPDFWNPKFRGPVCYNPAASASVLAYTLRRTKLALAGDSKEKILDEVRAALARKELPSPEPGAMSFMMSKDGYLSDAGGHWHPHLMFHVPKVAGASWGANLPGSPVVLDDREVPEPQTIFMVPVSRWSDGTTAAAH